MDFFVKSNKAKDSPETLFESHLSRHYCLLGTQDRSGCAEQRGIVLYRAVTQLDIGRCNKGFTARDSTERVGSSSCIP